MTELEMTTEADVETEEFTDELSDEALDRENGEGSRHATHMPCSCGCHSR